METLLDDQLVDTLQIVWEETPQYSGPRVRDSPAELRVLRDFLTTQFWQSRVQFIADGVLNRHGRVQEYSGFLFPEDMDPDDEPFEGVMVFDPLDTIYLSDGAFARLMNRYFETIIEGVASHQKDELKEAWWPEFLDIAQQIKYRVSG